ncbi:hypothetical protein [Methanosarcina sp. 2.H.A.1B.4]|uniref:hypothetical protein n=1 Tax=Methanosarcina sp. 2.H.A.1B.4 TaxID=1483600 RepID=UPI0012E05F5E|nr:hypothetical protein [Methanosarcina sp. 2.H.A.1B.4]
MNTSEAIPDLYTDFSAVDGMRAQREKSWGFRSCKLFFFGFQVLELSPGAIGSRSFPKNCYLDAVMQTQGSSFFAYFFLRLLRVSLQRYPGLDKNNN